MVFMVNLSELKLQKDRYFKKIIKKELKFGDAGLLIIKSGRIELLQIFFLKKLFKKLFKKKKNFIVSEFRKIWFYVCPNHIIQKKSKNSRMGKGKGSFERKIIRVRSNKFLVEFKGLSLIKILKILNFFKKKINIKLSLFFKKKKTYKMWQKQNTYSYFYKKYLS